MIDIFQGHENDPHGCMTICTSRLTYTNKQKKRHVVGAHEQIDTWKLTSKGTSPM